MRDRHVREIPSESEDSEIDSSGSDEECTPEQGLSRIEKIGHKILFLFIFDLIFTSWKCGELC